MKTKLLLLFFLSVSAIYSQTVPGINPVRLTLKDSIDYYNDMESISAEGLIAFPFTLIEQKAELYDLSTQMGQDASKLNNEIQALKAYNTYLLCKRADIIELDHDFGDCEKLEGVSEKDSLTDLSTKEAIDKAIKKNENKLKDKGYQLDLLTIKMQTEKDENKYVDYLKIKRTNIFLNGKESLAYYKMMYDTQNQQFQFVRNSGITIGDQSGSVYSELAGGNFRIIRISVGTMVTSSNLPETTEGGTEEENEEVMNTKKEEEAYQRLATYGGNMVLNMEYPALYLHTKEHDANLMGRFIVKGTADLPAFGTTTDSWAGSASVGFNLYGDVTVVGNTIRLFGNVNFNGITGTKTYKENLGLDNYSFTFNQLSLGLTLGEFLRISVIVATWGSEDSLSGRNPILNTQVLMPATKK